MRGEKVHHLQIVQYFGDKHCVLRLARRGGAKWRECGAAGRRDMKFSSMKLAGEWYGLMSTDKNREMMRLIKLNGIRHRAE